MLEMGSLNPHGRFVHLYVNGIYWGIMTAHERLVDAFLADYLGGAKEDYVNVRGNDNAGEQLSSPARRIRRTASLGNRARQPRRPTPRSRTRWMSPHLIDFMLVWFLWQFEKRVPLRRAGRAGQRIQVLAGRCRRLSCLRTSPALDARPHRQRRPGRHLRRARHRGPSGFQDPARRPHLQAFLQQRRAHPGRAISPASTPAWPRSRTAMIAECARWGYRTPDNWEAAAETSAPACSRTAPPILHHAAQPRALSGPRSAGAQPARRQRPQGYATHPQRGSRHHLLHHSMAATRACPAAAMAPAAQTWYRHRKPLIAHGLAPGNTAISVRCPPPTGTAAPTTTPPGPAAPHRSAMATGDEATIVGLRSELQQQIYHHLFPQILHRRQSRRIHQLTLGLVRDDGAVIYLNGTEVARSNMPAGAIGYTTRPPPRSAGTTKAGPELHHSCQPAGRRHQRDRRGNPPDSANSTDLRFDLSLTDAASSLPPRSNREHPPQGPRAQRHHWSALTDATFHVAHPLVAAGPYLFEQWTASRRRPAPIRRHAFFPNSRRS